MRDGGGHLADDRKLPGAREALEGVAPFIHGSTEDELIHERRFSDQEEVAHYILPGADHKLAAKLNAAQKLAQIVADAMLGRPWKVRRAVRAAGGMSRQAYRRRNAGGWAFGDEGEE